MLQGRQPRLLGDIRGAVLVKDKPPRQAAHEIPVGEQLFRFHASWSRYRFEWIYASTREYPVPIKNGSISEEFITLFPAIRRPGKLVFFAAPPPDPDFQSESFKEWDRHA
jgi:hypothetical protein